MLKIFPLLVVILILNSVERAIAQSTATITTQYAPFDPPTYITHPTGGYWERTGGNSDQRDIEDPARRTLSEWSNGYGSYYLIGKFGGTCNQLNSGNVYWFEETYRIAGVLGPYKVSLGKYSSSYDSYSDGLTQRLIYPNSYPYNPVNGTKGYLKTSQWYWLNSKIRIATVMYNYETGMYVSTGNYYEPEQGNIFSVPVASCEYTYH